MILRFVPHIFGHRLSIFIIQKKHSSNLGEREQKLNFVMAENSSSLIRRSPFLPFWMKPEEILFPIFCRTTDEEQFVKELFWFLIFHHNVVSLIFVFLKIGQTYLKLFPECIVNCSLYCFNEQKYMNYEIDGFSLNAVKGNVFTLEMYYTFSVGVGCLLFGGGGFGECPFIPWIGQMRFLNGSFRLLYF